MADWRGKKVVDRDGGKVGKLENVHLDRETDREKWGVVKTGLLGGRRLVPLAGASSTGNDVEIPASKKSVKGAPKADKSDELSPQQEKDLSHHYGLGEGSRASGEEAREASSAGGDGSGRSGRSEARGSDGDERSPVHDAQQREREEFGGFKFGAALLGWLIAVVLTVVLTAIAGLIGAGTGPPAAGSVGVAAIVSAVVVLIILALAYYAGGYVAGRMARFNGPKQGLGVWLIGLVVTIVLAVAGVVLGAQFNVLSQLNLPTIPLDPSSLTIGGVIALVVILVVSLLAAMAGGKTGTRYHRKVDRAGQSG